MKEDDLLPTSAPLPSAKKDPADTGLFGRGRYKFWALAAILLLAFWSMFTGTITLKWSAGNLNRFSDDLDATIHDDLDVLEIEEREKVVRHMWDVYILSRRIQLPRFWQLAFEAAYEEMASDEPEVRDAAVSEIARMSMSIVDLEPPPTHRKSLGEKLIKKEGRSVTSLPDYVKATCEIILSISLNRFEYSLAEHRMLIVEVQSKQLLQ